MEIKVLLSNQFTTTNWTGGTTTEFYISPNNSEYKKLNFDFRLSMAQVLSKESIFTPLKGISRKLMVLEGEIVLTHNNEKETPLKSFEVDTFDGGWTTSCIGSCTDFNLMTSDNTSGELTALQIEEEKSLEYKFDANLNFLCFYNYCGSVSITINSIKKTVEQGAMLIIEKPTVAILKIDGITKSTLIVTEITNTIES
ncbi:MAG: HutD family protein [Cellulophaga sp.]